MILTDSGYTATLSSPGAWARKFKAFLQHHLLHFEGVLQGDTIEHVFATEESESIAKVD